MCGRDHEMTKFSKELFNSDSMYVFYGPERKFVARFKRGGKADFLKFLIKNFSVEEYFALLDTAVAPLTALETKGYIHPNMKKALKAAGLAVTQENIPIMLANMYRPRVTPGLVGTEVENMAYFSKK